MNTRMMFARAVADKTIRLCRGYGGQEGAGEENCGWLLTF